MEAMMRFATAQGPRLLALGVGATALQTLQALSCDAAAAAGAARQLCDLRALLDSSVRLDSSLGALLLGAALALAVLVHLAARAYRAAAVYVVDFSVFAPPNGCESWACGQEGWFSCPPRTHAWSLVLVHHSVPGQPPYEQRPGRQPAAASFPNPNQMSGLLAPAACTPHQVAVQPRGPAALRHGARRHCRGGH
jgi:hypothetical protein